MFGPVVYEEEWATGQYRGESRTTSWQIHKTPKERIKANNFKYAIFENGCGIGWGGDTLALAKLALKSRVDEKLKEALDECLRTMVVIHRSTDARRREGMPKQKKPKHCVTFTNCSGATFR